MAFKSTVTICNTEIKLKYKPVKTSDYDEKVSLYLGYLGKIDKGNEPVIELTRQETIGKTGRTVSWWEVEVMNGRQVSDDGYDYFKLAEAKKLAKQRLQEKLNGVNDIDKIKKYL